MPETLDPRPQPVFTPFFYQAMAAISVLTLGYLAYDLFTSGDGVGATVALAAWGLVTGFGYLGDTGRIPGDMRDQLAAWKARQA